MRHPRLILCPADDVGCGGRAEQDGQAAEVFAWTEKVVSEVAVDQRHVDVVIRRMHRECEPSTDAYPEQILFRGQMNYVLPEIFDQRLDAGMTRRRWRAGGLRHDLPGVRHQLGKIGADIRECLRARWTRDTRRQQAYESKTNSNSIHAASSPAGAHLSPALARL
jgi:hypothetical protein